MKVIFDHPAFVAGKWYNRSTSPQEVPDGTPLPKKAKIVQAYKPEPPKVEAKPTLRDFDAARATSDAEQKINNKASK